MEKEAAEKVPNRKRRVIVGALAGVAVIVAAVLFIHSRGHETTDNAQLDGNIVPVRASVAGYIASVRFSDNQMVHQGDTLVVIQSKDYTAMVQQAQAALDNAKAMLEAARSGLSTADMNANASTLSSQAVQENVITAETRLWKAEKEYARVEAMAKDDAATAQQLDAMKAEVDMSKAQLEMARKQTSAAQAQAGGARSQAQAQHAQISLAEATVKQREAEVELARIRLGNTVIIAPFDGTVSRKSVELGQYVSVGSPVCAAVDIGHLWVTANFKETQLNDLKAGQPVNVEVDAFPDLELHGHITSLGGATGARFSLLPPDNSTGNFVKVTQRLSVRIDLDPQQDNHAYLALGLSAVVNVNTKS